MNCDATSICETATWLVLEKGAGSGEGEVIPDGREGCEPTLSRGPARRSTGWEAVFWIRNDDGQFFFREKCSKSAKTPARRSTGWKIDFRLLSPLASTINMK